MFEREAPSVHVGQILRQLRDGRGLSIRELSRISGLSANALSMIERGFSSPSVSTLYRLTDALNVPITALFRQDQDQEAIVFRSVANRTRVPFPLGVWEGLGGEAFIGRTQPFMLTLESGAESGKEKIVHTGHEFVLCLRGKLDYEVEGKFYTLEAGDSLLFAARLAHRWRNPGNTVTNAVIVLSGFEEFERPGIFHYPPET
jgi:transcriptional regulator with XRE-family HTH domain/mannose-6-phosphate isomerase-like protein (cupin superfamily)